jgi:hypothetical protein
MKTPNDQELLARCGIPAGRIIVDAIVAQFEALDDAIAYRSAALDDPPTHKRYVVTTELVSRI